LTRRGRRSGRSGRTSFREARLQEPDIGAGLLQFEPAAVDGVGVESRRVYLARLCLSQTGKEKGAIMIAEHFLVWVALLGVLAFLAFHSADHRRR